MTRRDFHTLAAYTTVAVLLLAVVLFVVMLTAVLDKAAKSAPVTPRATPSVASRDFARPFLTVPPSDHAAAGRAQTSPSVVSPATPAQRPDNAASVAQARGYSGSGAQTSAGQTNPAATPSRTADTTEGPDVREEAASGLTAWDKLAYCESRNRWHINTGNSYFGGLQENMAFWRAYDGTDYAVRPDLASEAEQITVAVRARDGYTNHAGRHWDARGYEPWPQCSVKEGLR